MRLTFDTNGLPALGTALLLLTLPGLGCPTPTGDDDDDDSAAPRETCLDVEWLSFDEGPVESYLAHTAHTWEFTRFQMHQPARICAVRAALHLTEGADAHVEIWPDHGSDGVSLNHLEPRAVLDVVEASPLADDWYEWDLGDAPLVLDPPGLVFVGMEVEPGGPSLLSDAALSGAGPEADAWDLQSMYWQGPPAAADSGLGAAPGDYGVRIAVEYFDQVEETWFTTVALEDIGLGVGARFAWADYDGDGDEDLMLDGPRLYENLGAGQFQERSVEAGLGSGSNGGVWGDFDNDGWPDYFASGADDRLYRNLGDGTFEDVTTRSGIHDHATFDCGESEVSRGQPTEASAWLDVDNDGWIDLYQANYECWPEARPFPDRLWRNLGDGTFEDASHLFGGLAPQSGRGLAPADFDNDGWMDLFVSNYRLDRNYLLHNHGGSFVNIGESSGTEGVRFQTGPVSSYYGHTIGSAWGDLDNDGDLDLFSANLAHPRFYEFSDRSMVFENLGGGDFANRSDGAGIPYRETDSSPTLLDVDNDGLLDIFYTCVYDQRESQLLRNEGDFRFRQSNYPSGLIVMNGWGNAASDVDGDGDQDLVTRDGLHLNENRAGGGAIQVRLHGSGAGATNTMALGAQALLMVEGEPRLQQVDGGHGTGCQDGQWLHFGLGSAAEADLTARFPASGTEIELPGLQAGARVEVWEDGTSTVRQGPIEPQWPRSWR